MPLIALYVELGMHTNAAAVTDKNGQRYTIMRVLRALWDTPRVRKALEALAAASAASAAPSPAASAAAASASSAASSSSSANLAANVPRADADAFGAFAETLVRAPLSALGDFSAKFAETSSQVKEAVFLLNDALGRLTDVHSRQVRH